MLSKLLAFGITALTLVHAAPAVNRAPLAISCSFNVQSTDTFTNAIASNLERGTYLITSVPKGDKQPLRSFTVHDLAIVGPEKPGAFAEWDVHPVTENAVTFTNKETHLPLVVNRDVCLDTFSPAPPSAPATHFAVEPAGHDDKGQPVYEVKLVNENLVWTVDNVSLRPAQGKPEQLWHFGQIEKAK
ncbi:hypothetical protein MVEN_00332900 [Mycena venus]|uniref:Uncharacterized protein n=1 Tax=Mycena venus TaxID=2733690 RepID=A0A8H6YTQ1_9AGAR|nr:hypothetical protein MVEN_00332900 [Mycena venus]